MKMLEYVTKTEDDIKHVLKELKTDIKKNMRIIVLIENKEPKSAKKKKFVPILQVDTRDMKVSREEGNVRPKYR